MILWYSGCGNSRFIAESLGQRLGDDKLVFIPEAARTGQVLELGEDETLGVVFPVYSWSVPDLVSDYIRTMKFSGKPGYVFAACTCGDNTGHTMRVIRKDLAAAGLELDSFHAFQMPNTYVNMAGFHLDSKELENSKIDAAIKQLDETAALIGKRSRGDFNRLLGGAPFLKTFIVKPLFYPLFVTDSKFRVSDQCIGCGLCAKNCPLQNITMENGRPHWNGHCTTCDSCYHRCPKHAISFGKATAGMGQYYFNR